jgi:hydrogenase/urease accessory protein HupE
MLGKKSGIAFLIAVYLCVAWPGAGRAHEMGIPEVIVGFSPEGEYRVEIPVNPAQLLQRVEVAEGKALTLDPTPEQMIEGVERGLPSMQQKIRVIFDGREVEGEISYLAKESDEFGEHGALVLTGAVPPGAKEFQFVYKLVFTRYALKVQGQAGGEPQVMWLEGAELSPPVSFVLPPPPTFGEVVKTYVYLGFTHILPKGLDHILFVLGLFLLSARLAPLLWQVTSFTAAHTVTLALATFGVVSLPSSIVEPLIALSIVYVAIENVIHEKLGRFRVVVVFAFGLLHGLGFAGVLSELGLPKSQLVPALLSFNVGVELGQLAVIALAWILVASWARKKEWYHRRVVVPGSLLIAAVGAYWTIERIWGAFG